MKLEIGYNHDFEIRRESYHNSEGVGFSVLFLSDLHLNKFSVSLVLKLKKSIEEINPTVIILGGDYVDTSKGLKPFNELLDTLSRRSNVFAIAGNHDYFFGIEKIKEVITQNNITWLDQESKTINIDGVNIKISNNPKEPYSPFDDFRILCIHKPITIDDKQNTINLIFAGHLHGCQFVFWSTTKGLYPGRLFYKWNILKRSIGESLYIISKGLGDTLPIRYNCKKDMVLVTIENQNKPKLVL